MPVDSFTDFRLINMGRQRQLDDETIHLRVFVQHMHRVKQCSLGDLLIHLHFLRLNTHLGTSFQFVSHIGLAGRIIAHLYDYQVRSTLPRSEQRVYLQLEFGTNSSCCSFTV